MNRSLSRSVAQRGVALVITLVMLSVVTLMAITFLAVSRRDRASVSTTELQSTARLMTESALARAKSEVAGRIMGSGNLLDFDFQVSTNFINPLGFQPAQVDSSNPTNVNFDYQLNGGPLSASDRVRLIGNLWINPRPPVFVQTNSNPRAPLDFRFYLDLNRNGRFETNGTGPEIARDGSYVSLNGGFTRDPSQALTNFFVGDPEWIGVTARPDLPHSPTNRFIGRYAYLVLPASRSLDWNFIYNSALTRDLKRPGYYRNQGLASWELNLGAFLYDLHPALTRTYAYNGLGGGAASEASAHALVFLTNRYAGSYANLAPAKDWFGKNANVIRHNNLDEYADGPAANGVSPLLTDNDNPGLPWVGSDNPNRYVQLDELFDARRVPAAWLSRLAIAQRSESSFDRYTFYRLLAQMGMDSSPADVGRINLNYDNRGDLIRDGFLSAQGTNLPEATALVAWTPLAFFNTTAQRLLSEAALPFVYVSQGNVRTTNHFLIGDTVVRPAFSLTNIMVYPTNEYTSTIHRMLQVAVNLHDASTRRDFPTVLQPFFRVEGTNIFIAGYDEITNVTFLSGLAPLDLRNAADRQSLASRPRAVVYDVPFIIGAKRGFPNFNEFSLVNVAEMTRKLEVRKRSELGLPVMTNQMFQVNISNQFGLEAWNSYATAYPRNLRLEAAGSLTVAVTNYAAPGGLLRYVRLPYQTNQVIAANAWLGRQFRVPVFRSVVVVSNETFMPVPRPRLIAGGTNVQFVENLGFYLPSIGLSVTNRFYYALVDTSANRLVDFVCLGNMASTLDLTREISGRSTLPAGATAAAEPPNVWVTNRAGASTSLNVPTVGIQNQIEIALGNQQVSAQQWRSYNNQGGAVDDKNKSIDRFRLFCGLSPLTFTQPQDQSRLRGDLAGKTAMQVPYSPTRKLYLETTWQANDPLVHYLVADLLDPRNRPGDPGRTNSVRFAVPPSAVVTNSNLGLMNLRYSPWGGNPQVSTDRLAYDPRVKDPMVQSSDDWDFPTNVYPNVGWIGRVHRGTPWQTIYLKSGVVPTNQWLNWAGSYGTHPTNDWNLVDLFTVAPNHNASRGLISVNQTNLAAWSAVLAGVSVLSNTTPAVARSSNRVDYVNYFIEPNLPGRPQLATIVAGINRTRQLEVNEVGQYRGRFQTLGHILATPELTLASPFINTNNLLSDAVVERIPQQILSLLRPDEPRFVIYSYGQALKEAPNSLYLGVGVYNRMCTNYQVKAEFVTRTVVRLDGTADQPRAVVESYNELTPE